MTIVFMQDGWNPLMAASSRGHLKIVEALVAAGTDVNAQNVMGQTALMLAADNNQIAVAELLVIKGRADRDLRDKVGVVTELHCLGFIITSTLSSLTIYNCCMYSLVDPCSIALRQMRYGLFCSPKRPVPR